MSGPRCLDVDARARMPGRGCLAVDTLARRHPEQINGVRHVQRKDACAKTLGRGRIVLRPNTPAPAPPAPCLAHRGTKPLTNLRRVDEPPNLTAGRSSTDRQAGDAVTRRASRAGQPRGNPAAPQAPLPEGEMRSGPGLAQAVDAQGPTAVGAYPDRHAARPAKTPVPNHDALARAMSVLHQHLAATGTETLLHDRPPSRPGYVARGSHSVLEGKIHCLNIMSIIN